MKSLILLCLVWVVTTGISLCQSQEEFEQGVMDFYVNTADTLGNSQRAMALFEALEANVSLQEYGNYIMLSQVFEKFVMDEKMVLKCTERAQEVINAVVAASSPTEVNSGSDPADIWQNKYYGALFTTTDPNNARNAFQFLEKHPELHNFNNFAYVGYAFERNKDFENAQKAYKKALLFINDDTSEYYPYSYYTNFLSRTGRYLEAETYIRKIEALTEKAGDLIKLSYMSDGFTTRAVYSLHIGDYQEYAKNSSRMYDYFSANYGNSVPCFDYQMPKFAVAGFASEVLHEKEKATAFYAKYDSTHQAWIHCHNQAYPDNSQYPLYMLPLYMSKIGKSEASKEQREANIQEVLTHYSSYADYADISVHHHKATHLAFLRYDKYQEVFLPIINRIERTKDFSESTLPLSNYAYFTMRDRLLNDSFSTYQRLYKINLEWLNDLFITFGEKAFVTYYNARLKQGYDNFHSYVKITKQQQHATYPEATEMAYDNLLLTKSIAFKGSVKRKRAFLKSNDKEVQELYNKWLNKKQQLIHRYQIIQNPNATEYEKQGIGDLTQLQTEVIRLENELANKAQNFHEHLKIERPKWKKVRNQLKEGEAAIEMVRFQWRDQVYYSDSAYYAAYIIKKDSPYPEVVYLTASAAQLDDRYYKNYKNSIRLKIEDGASYKAYWEPLKPALEGIKKVYFSPDGIYHLINLPSLQNPETGGFILDEVNIQYLTSTGDLRAEDKAIKPATAVLIGRPTYEVEGTLTATATTRSFVNNFRGGEIDDLPGTEEEVKAIARHLEAYQVNTTTYLKDEATEEVMYTLKDPDILHIATHGYWSGLDYTATQEYRMFNAMVNSGLLLSGVVNYYSSENLAYTHDGVLTAYEAQHLNLENTALVVLSACETGLGHLDAGEGVYGLQRAFRSAGAKSMILSLWKVDDAATSDFMIMFYENLMTMDNKSQAFYTTQIKMKEKYQQPYYWGAFVLVGE